MIYKSTSKRIFDTFNYLFITLVCLSCILPFVHLLAVSFSSTLAVQTNSVIFWPVDFNLYAYEFAFSNGRFLAALWVSIQRIALGLLVNLLLIILTAYPLSHNKSKLHGRNIYMAYFVFTMIFNGGLIPTFIVVSRLGLLNSLWALVLPGALPVFSMIILMNFIRNLPEELQESAMLDGAGSIKILYKIMLPLLKPCLATVALFSIVGHWNDWFSGLIYMRNPANFPLQTYLQFLLLRFEQIMMMAGGDAASALARMNVQTGRAAQLFMGAVPVLIIYPFLQRYFTTGLVMGSVKG
ncbi:MAG: carbohydrate ABC transporter permease [Defluviitaleaceae bacterium]|nr:carbohydrate ABC transporter permease [Defluviitaleaceae bacterium]